MDAHSLIESFVGGNSLDVLTGTELKSKFKEYMDKHGITKDDANRWAQNKSMFYSENRTCPRSAEDDILINEYIDYSVDFGF